MDTDRRGAPPHGSTGTLHRWIWGLLLLGMMGFVLWSQVRPTLPAANMSIPTPVAQAAGPIAALVAAGEAAPLTVTATLSISQSPAAAALSSRFISRELVTTTLAIPPAAELPEGVARGVALSADGRVVAVTLRAANPAAQPAALNGYEALYRFDPATGELSLVAPAQDGGIGSPVLSADGRVIAFYAWATTLVENDTNAVQDAFVYDDATKQLQRVSLSSDGTQANDRSGDTAAAARPALSGDGALVAFHSRAANLVADDTNGAADVFVRDRTTGITSRVSLGSDGTQADGDATNPALSADGRFVVFQSTATNLDPALPGPPDISQTYAHDRATGRTWLLSRSLDGAPGNGGSRAAALSGDGQWVAFVSDATNLAPGDTNQTADIFLHHLTTGSTTRVSVASAGTQANRASDLPALSPDGRYVVFVSAATNLVSGDGNQADDLFLYDRLAQHTSRVSVGVAAPWTGIQGNGSSQGPAALSVGGRVVAFVSAASNLLGEETTPAATAFLHIRQDPPLYAMSGRVLDVSRASLVGVEVAAGPHRATTDADGHYTFPYLTGGTYTLVATKPGYTFSPPRRTVSLPAGLTGQDFAGFPGNDPSAFLDLPLAYDGLPATFLHVLADTDEGGLVDSWFDHDTPDYRKNDAVLLWDGRLRRAEPYNDLLGCFERRCYDGHDGIDFPYRDPVPVTPGIYEPLLIYPAAEGRVIATHRACASGAPKCNGGYGNEVILAHENGYFTRYSHLDRIDVPDGLASVTRTTVLGTMGSTGNSFGAHLHFAVHLDNGNGQWDGGALDRPLDPFGWSGSGLDPWTVGAVSRRLWRYSPTAEVVLLGSQGATLRDGGGVVTANLPADAFAGQVRVELSLGGAPARPMPPQRSLGRAFRLQVLDWLPGAAAPEDAPLARPVELAVQLQGADTRHLALDHLLLTRWDAETHTWTPLPTVLDEAGQVVYAATDRLGEFDLQAPLRCPADRLEPDDGYYAAVFVSAGHPPLTRLFDGPQDEDWLRLDAAAGTSYQVIVDELSEGVMPLVEVYDVDGLTRLAANGAGTPAWQPTVDGAYFVRVAPAPGSAVGCEATYRVAVTE
ncbi:MAG: PD40 domain-containing protein [Caldilineaceae bacterium]|nr:PD40 domain-containing protein [Caldilineaceae bacterium]